MSKPRVLFVSDIAYPWGNTGFGIAGGKLLEGLVMSGEFDIAHLGRLGYNIEGELPFRLYVPPYGDANGIQYISYVCEFEKPDLIVFEADPHSIMDWRKNVQVRRVSNLLHMPVEGEPLLRPFADTVREIVATGGVVTTYTDYGKQVIDKGVFEEWDEGSNFPTTKVLKLGNDHANFRKYDREHREEIRKRLGWDDRFVVMNVARNAGRKGWPNLLEGIQLAAERHPEVLLYAHCVPFENYVLNGHNLPELAKYYGIAQSVQFLMDLRDPVQGIAYDDNPNGLTLIDLYNAADLFLAPTTGEGWNMPQCEAAACGLPVATTRYSGGWEVAEKFAWPLLADTYVTHTSGVRQAIVRPQQISYAIDELINHPGARQTMSEVGLATVAEYRWCSTVKRFVGLARAIVNGSEIQ